MYFSSSNPLGKRDRKRSICWANDVMAGVAAATFRVESGPPRSSSGIVFFFFLGSLRFRDDLSPWSASICSAEAAASARNERLAAENERVSPSSKK
jgi:hypothetical protein